VPVLLLIPISAASNLLLLTTIARCRHLHTVSNALLFALGVVDLLMALLVLPPWAAALWLSRLPTAACRAVGVATTALFLLSLSTVACIALDRYLRICRPMHYASLVTRRRAAVLMATTSTHALLVSSLPLLRHFQPPTISVSACSLHFPGHRDFAVVLLITAVAPSCLVVVVCYWKIFRSVAGASHRRRPHSRAALDAPRSPNAPLHPFAHDGASAVGPIRCLVSRLHPDTP
jgi:hypothetical protein